MLDLANPHGNRTPADTQFLDAEGGRSVSAFEMESREVVESIEAGT